MSQRLATETAHLPDKKSANIDKIIGLSNSCIVIRNMKFIKIKGTSAACRRGVFGADMQQVSLINDGPVTIIIDSRLKE